jgi:hypothetical protein
LDTGSEDREENCVLHAWFLWLEENNCRHGSFLLAAALDRRVWIKEYLMVLAGAFLLTCGSGDIEHVSLEQREVSRIGTV